jgi:PAS domain S-box-containing protein
MFKKKFNDNIRFRFLIVISVILFIGTLTISLILALNEERVLKNSLTTTGQSFASYIAKLGKDPLVMKDGIQLDAIVNDATKDENIAYCVIRDAQGTPLTTQFASINYHVPRLNAVLSHLAGEHDLPDIINIIKKKEPIIEVSTPVMIDIKKIGMVTIGMSAHNVNQEIVKTIIVVIALNVAMAFVLGVVLFVVSKKIVLKPIIEIARASSNLARGDLPMEVKARTTGEVKNLVDSFNDMVKNLKKVTVSKDYVDNIIRSMINALIVVSPDNKIIRANEATCRLLGYTETELIGLPAETIFGAKGTQKSEWMESMLAIGNIEESFITKNGCEVPVLLSASAMRDHDGLIRGVVYVAEDISERKQTYQALLESEQKLHSIIQGSPIPAFVIDKDHKITYWNRALEEITGISAQSMVGTTQQWRAFYNEERPCMADMLVDENITEIHQSYSDKHVKSTLREEAYEAMDFFPAMGKKGKWLRFTAAAIRNSKGNLIGAMETLEDFTERKRMEAEEIYKTLTENSLASVFIVQDGKYRFINNSAITYTNYTAEELVGQDSDSIVYPEDKERLKKMAREMLSGASNAAFKFRMLTKHNQIRWLSQTVTPIIYEGRPAILGNAIDITEIRQAEELYKTLTERALAGVYVVQEGKFRFVNSNVASYAGYTKEELAGEKAEKLIHPEDREKVRNKTRSMLHGESVSPHEYRIITKNGEMRWIMETVTSISYGGKPAILGNSMDITEFRKSREELEELKALESSILSSISHVVLGLQNGRILFVNDAVETVFGWKPEELIGQSISVLYNSESEYDNFDSLIRAGLKDHQKCSQELEVSCRNKTGANVICGVTYSRIGDVLDDNNIVATYEDITDRKRTSLQLLQSEKMASIGQLAAGVAHEINNPTAFVSSNLKTLSDYLNDIIKLINQYHALAGDLKKEAAIEPLREILAEHLKLIEDLEKGMDIDYIIKDVIPLITESREGTERIKKIVQDLKNFAHPGDEKLRTVNVNDSIESTLNIVWNEIKYKAVVHKEYGDIPDIMGYPQQLNQVFMNLLVNATQAIKERGEIRITTKVDDGKVEMIFTDTGAGIPKENLSKLFDPFFTTKDVGTGTGLGLHVAYSIIKKHNGTIEVDSIVDKGTTFTVKLPLN